VQEDIRLNVDSIEFPYLLMHGTADRLSMFAGSERFFANSKRYCFVLTIEFISVQIIIVHCVI
jgi:hypothetical protein